MNKKSLLLGFVALAMVGCGNTTSVKASDSGTTSQGESSSQAGTSSSTQEDSSKDSSSAAEETYKIVLPEDNRYTLTADKATAKKGETVTVTATASDGFEIVAVLVSGTAIAKSGEKYIFTMPDHDVRLTANLNVLGDVTLGGDIAVALTKDDATGIYSAKNVDVAKDSNFSYFIVGKDSKKTELDITNVDRTKCFADIEYSVSKTYKLKLAGGAKYDFYYNPANVRSCYVQRTEITSLPNNAAGLEKLFYGRVQSAYSVYPTNVNRVTYTSTATDESYEWNKLKDNKSLATVKKLSDKTDTAVVYKEIKDGLYYVVDTYTEGKKTTGEGDATKNYDTKKFSGKYKISDNDDDRDSATDDHEFNNNRQFVNSNMAYFDANAYSHDMNSIDFDIMYAYRVQKKVEYEVSQASVKVTSEKNADGGFTTTVVSSSTYDATKVVASGSTEKYHDEYTVHLAFNKAGAIVSGDYVNTHYPEASYDFTNFVITGEGKIAKKLQFNYYYGDAKDDLNPFNKDPYFITSLAPTVVNDSIANPTESNSINSGDCPSDYLALNALPETALDGWQYKIQTSSNESVIKWNTVYERWDALTLGTSELTVSNSTTKNPVGKVTVNVLFTKTIRDFNLTLQYGYDGYGDDGEIAGNALIYEKHTKRYQLGAMAYDGTGKCAIPGDVTLKLSDETTGLEVSVVNSIVSPSEKDILFDATNMKAPSDGASITLTVNSAFYDKEVKVSTFTVYLFQTNYTNAFFVGTWNDTADNASMVFTADKVATTETYYSEKAPYYGYVTVKGTKYEFGYNFLETTINFDFSLKFKALDGVDNIYSKLHYAEATKDEEACLQMGLATGVNDYSEGSETISEILGGYTIDSEGDYFYSYANFTKAA
ncbi:MAG: hypothetical protein WCR67_05180 [Bacilli bacterium]